jgi:fructuronate reductase
VSEPLHTAALASLPPGIRTPDYDFATLGIGIVHLGLGAFHRAHQALYTEDAVRAAGGDWGILGVALHNATVPDALNSQEQLYTVEFLDAAVEYRVVAAIRAALTAHRQPVELQRALCAATTHLVTLTVTEKGYCLGVDGELDFTHPEITHDLSSSAPPTSAIGWLAESLHARFASHGRPLTIVSCDNLKNNGAQLERAVTAFMERKYPRALGWLRADARFPRTVVDCIVPAATEASGERVRRALGLADAACVQREGYSQWVIEDRFAGPRPAWERAGAQIVAEPADYGRLKLHVLNTCHSALAYLGVPRGHRFVREAMADSELRQFLEELVAQEIAPALKRLPVEAYWRGVCARFLNPSIDYRLAQIAADGAQKLSERVFPLMVANLAAAAPIARLARIVGGWLRSTGQEPATALGNANLFPEAIRASAAARAAIVGSA